MDFRRMMLVAVGLVVVAVGQNAPPSTTAAPKGTTLAPKPVPTTAAPKVTTAAPKVTTAAPKVTTAAPKVTTAAPKVTTAAPKVTTAAPKVTTAAPKATTAAPKATTAAPKATTAAPKGTTTAPKKQTTTKKAVDPDAKVTVLSGSIDLEVEDKLVWQTEPVVVKSMKAAMEELLGPKVTVEILSITEVAPAPTTTKAPTKLRRLDAKGTVRVNTKSTDPTNKLTPAKVQGTAPQLPKKINDKLKANGKTGADVKKATVAKPTKQTPFADPCAHPPTAAPASPCAVMKYSEQESAVGATTPAVSGMIWLAVPCLLLLAFVVRSVRQRASRAYATVEVGRNARAEEDGTVLAADDLE